MDDYQNEQREALAMVRDCLGQMRAPDRRQIRRIVSDYLRFRRRVDAFLKDTFSTVCTSTCFRSQRSACCSREGIITFFADVLINVLSSQDAELNQLDRLLQSPNNGLKCVYLGQTGCLWKVKPIVCEMFLCDRAKAEVFDRKPDAKRVWNDLEKTRKRFTWPDRSVLFDQLETMFIQSGRTCSLMYFHNSPGLLRVKKTARLINS